jgi:hypothetical protein
VAVKISLSTDRSRREPDIADRNGGRRIWAYQLLLSKGPKTVQSNPTHD